METVAMCSVCGKNPVVASEESEVDYCLMCWFTGKYFRKVLSSEERAELLPRIRLLDGVASADIWHFGAGSFSLAIMLRDGRLVMPGLPAEIINGQRIVVPFIPPQDGEWAVMVTRPSEDFGSWADAPTIMPDLVSDEDLVGLIEEIAAGATYASG